MMADITRQHGMAAEDYVKSIYAHTEWQSRPVTTSVLAARLGLAPSSVTEMVVKLAAAGLVTHVRYGAVTLTAEGEGLALRMLRRHRLIETWLVECYGYRWDEVHDEAEVLEHAMSDRMLGEIARRLGDPQRDPHGDPIPRDDGSVLRPAAVVASDLPDGAAGVIARVSDRDPETLRSLASCGVGLGAEVLRRKDGVVARIRGADLPLSPETAAAVWVTDAGPE